MCIVGGAQPVHFQRSLIFRQPIGLPIADLQRGYQGRDLLMLEQRIIVTTASNRGV